MKNNKILFFALLAGLLCFAKPVFADLGISPSDWIEANGLAGQQIGKTFTLSRSDTGEDLNFTTQMTGDITSWITLENGNSFTMQAGQQQYPVRVDLNIPQNAEKKEYKEEIRLNSSSKVAQTGQVGVLLSALIRIDLTVSDKPFLNYSIQQIEIPEQETGNNVSVVLKVWNQGNVVAKPTKVTADIFDKFNSTKINSFTITDLSAINGIAPFTQGNMNLQLPIQLAPDQYWANISVYQDEKLLKQDDLIFNIVKAGALKKAITLNKIIKNNYLLIGAGAVLLVVIVIVAVICILLFKRKKHVKKDRK
jgi:hypothetical protein